MLEDCAAKDEPGAYEDMLNDWKLEFQMPSPLLRPHLRTSPSPHYASARCRIYP
jgi:hypothetical protein